MSDASSSTETRVRPSGTGLIVEAVRDLRALVPDWEALAADAMEPNPFYEPWMLLPALEAYAGARDGFECFAVWDNGVLGALFPMKREGRYRGLPAAVLRSWRHRNMLLSTPLVRAKNAVACLRAFLESGAAPVIEFEHLPAGGPFYGALVEAAGSRPWFASDAYARALLHRDRDPRVSFNSNMKNNLRRCEKRIRALGRLEAVRLAPDGDAAAWTEQFFRLEAAGWKGKAGTALACREDDRKFAAEVFAEAHRRGRLLITGLDLDGKPIARHCLFTGADGAYTFKIAYDEAYERCSPGILAEVDNVRQFLETPALRWIDSFTAPENVTTGRVWKDRLTVQRVAVGAQGAGKLAVALMPLLRLAKTWLKERKKGGRTKEGDAAGSRTPGASSGDRTPDCTVFGPREMQGAGNRVLANHRTGVELPLHG
jgi:CelD/BcsL family acetyltransferase involved in cellulose biosynthesis